MVTTSPLALVVKCFIALVPVGVRFCLESQPLWVMYFVWTQARIKGRVQVLSRLPFKKSHPRTALPLDMFYSYVRTLPRRCWSSLSLNQTNLICWDRSGQMVRRLLFLYFFHRLQRWQKQRGQLGVCVCVCVCVCQGGEGFVWNWLAVLSTFPAVTWSLAAQAQCAGASVTECQGRPSACHSQTALDQKICEGK